MQLRTRNRLALLAVLATVTASAHAFETGVEWLKLSGFGTVAATRTNLRDNEGVSYLPTFNADHGVRDSWSSSIDSRLGFQATAAVNSQLSATVQLLRRRTIEGDYKPTVQWANVKYDVTADTSIRVGRIGVPVFLISDYLNVGYSQPWIRPPVDVYKMMPLTHMEGADAVLRFHAGDTNITLQPFVGSSKSAATTLNGLIKEVNWKSLAGANIAVEHDAWTVRYANMRGISRSPGIFGSSDVKDNFNNLGIVYDMNAVLLQGEYVWRTTNQSQFGKYNQQMAYITAGYRIGTVMPNITFSRFIDNSTLGTFGTTEDTVSVGVRWDFYKNMALKAQLDHVTRPSGTNAAFGAIGLFHNDTAGIPQFATSTDKSVNILAIGLDFVF